MSGRETSWNPLIQALHLKFKIQLEIIWHESINNWDNGTGKQKRGDGWKFSDLEFDWKVLLGSNGTSWYNKRAGAGSEN